MSSAVNLTRQHRHFFMLHWDLNASTGIGAQQRGTAIGLR